MRGNGRPLLTAQATADLVERSRTCSSVFGELYDLHVDRIYRFFLAHTNTVEQAEDLTEETFTRALEALTRPEGAKGRYEDRGVFSSWLLRIAANALRDQWRRDRGTIYSLDMVIPDDGTGERLGDRLVDLQQVDPKELVEDWERAAQIRSCLLLLPDDDYRRVLQLRYWEERGWEEVARQLGRSEGAVKKLGKRALAILAVLLQEDRLRERLPELTEDQQRAVRFRYLEGYDLESVARLLGRTVESVKWLLEIALKRLGEGEHAHV